MGCQYIKCIFRGKIKKRLWSSDAGTWSRSVRDFCGAEFSDGPKEGQKRRDRSWNSGKKSIYTDLAVEERESFPGDRRRDPRRVSQRMGKGRGGHPSDGGGHKDRGGGREHGKAHGDLCDAGGIGPWRSGMKISTGRYPRSWRPGSLVFWPFIRSEQTEMEERRPYWRWGWETRTPHPTPWALWC